MLPGTTGSTALTAWLRGYTPRFAAGLRAVVLIATARFTVQMALLYLLSLIIHQVIIERASPGGSAMLSLAGLALLQWGLLVWFNRQKLHLSQQVLQVFQTQLLHTLARQSLATIRDHSVATWQSFFLHRIPALQSYYSDYLPQQRLAVIMPLLVLLVVLPVSWLVALVLLVTAPLVPLFMWLVGRGAATAHQRHFKALERLGSIFLDRLQARQLLHVHQAVAQQKRVFTAAASALKERTLSVLSVAFLSSSVLDFFATVAMALVAVFVGFSLLGSLTFGSWQGGLNLQQGLFVLLLAPLFFSELKTLGRYYHLRAEALGAADAIEAAMASAEALPQLPASLSLSVQNLRVPAAGDRELLRARQLSLQPGDRVLLQGASGSGKTTLLEALLGMRNCVADNSAMLAREQVAWLDQQPLILPGSVRENLALGTAVDDERLRDLLRDVELDTWLQQQPQGLDTAMGDYPPLSGGQRQRLALARLLLFDKPIIFLDEPTAHLGEDQAQRMIALLQRTLVNKTLVWVGHELTATRFFTKRWQISAGCLEQISQDASVCV